MSKAAKSKHTDVAGLVGHLKRELGGHHDVLHACSIVEHHGGKAIPTTAPEPVEEPAAEMSTVPVGDRVDHVALATRLRREFAGTDAEEDIEALCKAVEGATSPPQPVKAAPPPAKPAGDKHS